MSESVRCPRCREELGALATYCWRCEEYVADMATGSGTPGSSTTTAAPDGRLEKEIQHAGVQVLESLGFHVYNLSQARASKQSAGLGDSYVVGQGRTAWVEWKRPGEVQTADQVLFGERVRANGGEYHVWSSEEQATAWALEARG